MHYEKKVLLTFKNLKIKLKYKNLGRREETKSKNNPQVIKLYFLFFLVNQPDPSVVLFIPSIKIIKEEDAGGIEQ